MVFLADFQDKPLLCTYALFGVQHPTLTPQKKTLISNLYNLLATSASHIDHLRDENHGAVNNAGGSTTPSTTFVVYWLHSSDYKTFVSSTPFHEFWDALDDEAGVWREVMTVPNERYMFAASQQVKWGMARSLELRQSNDEGYWGVYRHRLGDVGDSYTSPYTTSSKGAGEEEKMLVIDIPERLASDPSEDKKIRKGRVVISSPPDNLCFVREGQRQPKVLKEEIDLWLETISPHARSWIDHLDTERAKNGVMSFTTHLGHSKPQAPAKDGEEVVEEAEPMAETNQLAYFLDLAKFEKSGRSHKGHVQLRKNVMQHYGPGGQMEKLGKAELFVELCILKSEDLEAEYIGCAEGTGLMWLQGL